MARIKRTVLLMAGLVGPMAILVVTAGCPEQEEGLRKIGPGRYERMDPVEVLGVIRKKISGDEYLLHSPVFGNLLVRPKFAEGLFLKEGSSVLVQGYWEKPVGAEIPMIVDAKIEVRRRPA